MGIKSIFKRNKKGAEKRSLKPIVMTKKEQNAVQISVKEQPRLIKFEKNKEVPTSNKSLVPSGCKNYLGYLHKRPKKSSKVPDDCVVCLPQLPYSLVEELRLKS